MELDEVINRLKGGEISALETLYKEMHVALYAFTLSIVKDHEAASDLVQDAFVQIYSKASLYKENTHPKAWIYRIVRNLAIDHLRKQSKFIRFTENTELNIPSKDSAIENFTIDELLKELDDLSHQIVLLYVFEGFKHSEIAEILDMKEGTIRWKYREALKKLEKSTRGDVNE